MRNRGVLAVGVALFVAGVGTIMYAHEEQVSLSHVGSVVRYHIWHGNAPQSLTPLPTPLPTKNIYGAGVVLMAVGAGVAAFGWRRDETAQ